MKDILERFYGVWIDKNGNVLFIKPGNSNEVKVSFASGRTKAPVERSFMQQKLTIDLPGEFDKGFGELIVQFGAPYYGPQLHLKYKVKNKLGSGHANKLTLNLKWHKNASETALIDQFFSKTALL
jgi:hypothetical protein